MNLIIKIFILSSLFYSCNYRNTPSDKTKESENVKERSPVIIVNADSIQLTIEIKVHSKDSIRVNVTLINKAASDIVLYKPLLPKMGGTEDLFSILNSQNYERLNFVCQSSEQHFFSNSHSTSYISPKPEKDNFITLHREEELKCSTDIQDCYRFQPIIDQGTHDFLLSYTPAFSFMVNGQQDFKVDSIDGVIKPVYFLVKLKESDDPNDMRIKFSVPNF